MLELAYLTQQSAKYQKINSEINEKAGQSRSLEIEVAHLKEERKNLEQSELPILVYFNVVKEAFGTTMVYVYYLPEIGIIQHEHYHAYKSQNIKRYMRHGAVDLHESKLLKRKIPDSAANHVRDTVNELIGAGNIKSWYALKLRLRSIYLS